MAETERDYSDYLQHMAIMTNSLMLLSGFTFTAITVLITTLPNPKSTLAQVTLFFLFVSLATFLVLLSEHGSRTLFLCKNVPPVTRRLIVTNVTFYVSVCIWPVGLMLMFLLAELTYLAITSTIIYITAMTLVLVTIFRPAAKRRKLYTQNLESKPT